MLSNMQLTIKIPEDDIKIAAQKAILIMREVRKTYLEEGNHLFASELVTPKSVKSTPINGSPVFEPPEKPKKEFKRSLSWKDKICETANLCEFRTITPRNSPKELIFNNEPPKDSIETKIVDAFQSINITEKIYASVMKSFTPKATKEEKEIEI